MIIVVGGTRLNTSTLQSFGTGGEAEVFVLPDGRAGKILNEKARKATGLFDKVRGQIDDLKGIREIYSPEEMIRDESGNEIGFVMKALPMDRAAGAGSLRRLKWRKKNGVQPEVLTKFAAGMCETAVRAWLLGWAITDWNPENWYLIVEGGNPYAAVIDTNSWSRLGDKAYVYTPWSVDPAIVSSKEPGLNSEYFGLASVLASLWFEEAPYAKGFEEQAPSPDKVERSFFENGYGGWNIPEPYHTWVLRTLTEPTFRELPPGLPDALVKEVERAKQAGTSKPAPKKPATATKPAPQAAAAATTPKVKALRKEIAALKAQLKAQPGAPRRIGFRGWTMRIVAIPLAIFGLMLVVYGQDVLDALLFAYDQQALSPQLRSLLEWLAEWGLIG